MVKGRDLGKYLRAAREKAGLSQVQVAHHLKLTSGQCISDWERNKGSTIPVRALKKLIPLYGLDPTEVFEILLEYQCGRLEEKITEEFYAGRPAPARRKENS